MIVKTKVGIIIASKKTMNSIARSFYEDSIKYMLDGFHNLENIYCESAIQIMEKLEKKGYYNTKDSNNK